MISNALIDLTVDSDGEADDNLGNRGASDASEGMNGAVAKNSLSRIDINSIANGSGVENTKVSSPNSGRSKRKSEAPKRLRESPGVDKEDGKHGPEPVVSFEQRCNSKYMDKDVPTAAMEVGARNSGPKMSDRAAQPRSNDLIQRRKSRRNSEQTGNGGGGPSLSHALFLDKAGLVSERLESSTNGGPSNMDMDDEAPLQDPLFQNDTYLSPIEMEFLWLGEESMFAMGKSEFQFDFIYEHASAALRVELRKLDRYSSEQTKINSIVRTKDRLVKQRFRQLRESLKIALDRGYRRPILRKEIARLRLESKKNGIVDTPMQEGSQQSYRSTAGEQRQSFVHDADISNRKEVSVPDTPGSFGRDDDHVWLHQRQIPPPQYKFVEQINPDTLNVICIHENESIAAQKTGLSSIEIIEAIQEEPHFAGGFLWRFSPRSEAQTSDRSRWKSPPRGETKRSDPV